MLNQRRRAIWIAGAAIVGVWVVAWVGHTVARHSRMTAEKVHHYLQTVDFGQLRSADRQHALRTLARKINGLSYEERRRMRRAREWETWFSQMTEPEKEQFIEATLPTGIKQILAAFEQMPEPRRRRMLEEALRRLREAPDSREIPLDMAGEGDRRPQPPPPISPELETKVRTLGLKTFLAESSAQTKAEVAPLLEEIQRMIETRDRPGAR